MRPATMSANLLPLILLKAAAAVSLIHPHLRRSDSAVTELVSQNRTARLTAYSWSSSWTQDHFIGQRSSLPASGLAAKSQPIARVVLVVVFLLLVVLCLTAWAVFRRKNMPPAQRAVLVTSLINPFLDSVNYTSFVIDSLPLAHALGTDAEFSGWMISVFKVGTFAGMICIWLLFQKLPVEKACRWVRSLAVGAVTVMIFSTAMYAGLIWSLSRESGSVDPEWKWWVIGLRFLLGSALGFSFLTPWVTTMFTPQKDRSQAFVQLGLVLCMGASFGCFLAAAAHFLLDAFVPPLLSLPLALLVLQALFFIIVAVEFPSLDVADAMPASGDSTPGNTSKGAVTAKLFIVACLLFGSLRRFGVSSVEAASSMILEHEYGWSFSSVGIAIGATFLVSIPSIYLYHMLKKRGCDEMWFLRGCLLACILGLVLMLHSTCDLLLATKRKLCSFLLLSGDSLFLPSMMMANFLTDGMMMSSAQTDGWFKRENVIIANIFFGDGIGRAFGPPYSRMTLDQLGRDSYVGTQFLICVAALVIIELAVFLLRPEVVQSFGTEETDNNEKPS